jgi:phage terminase small subunit
MGRATTQHPALQGLTEKRRRFVLAYVGEALGNATEAARIAGYAHPNQQGSETLAILCVQKAIQALTAPKENEAIATSEALHKRLSDIALGRDSDAKPSDSVNATKLLLTARGELVKRVERVEHAGSKDELIARLEATLAKLKGAV